LPGTAPRVVVFSGVESASPAAPGLR